MNPVLTKSYKATGAIAAYLIAKASGDKTVAIASAATDLLVGAVGSIAAATGDMVDFVEVGIGEVKLGGSVDFNDPLTANGDGEAIKAVVTNGTAVRIIGFARAGGVDGDVIPYLSAPGFLSKPAA